MNFGGFFSDLGTMVFFDTIKTYLMDEANYLMNEILGNTYALIGGILLTLMTIWVLIHGYRIMSGQSRDSLMGFMMTAGKAVVIIAVATGVGANTGNLFTDITEGISESSMYLVTGDSNQDPYKEIDKNLTYMQAGLGAIRSLESGGDQEVIDQKNQALWMSAVGTAGPAIVAGTMLIINKFAWSLFIGFAPIFILCLLFEQTKSMFTKWLNFGIGITVSLAVLTFMTGMAMKMVLALTGAVLGMDLLNVANGGFTSAAMQQGGLGMILTALLITVPNMAASFVGGFTSGFSGYNNFAGMGGGAGGGNPHFTPGINTGGTVTQSGPVSAPPPSGGVSPTISHGSRHTVPSESSAGPNYNAVRTDSSMGYAAQGGSSGSSSAAVGAGAAYGGLSAASGGYSGSSDVSSGGSSPASSNSTSTVQPSPISSGGSSASAPSSTAPSSSGGTNYSSTAAANAAVAASTSASAPPPAGSTSSSTVTPTGSVTANTGVNQTDVNSIRQGSQLPTRKG